MAKLTNEQKIEIYERRLKGESLKFLSFNFNISIHNVQYLIRLIDKHGYSIIRSGENQYYSKEFKELTLNRILINNGDITDILPNRHLSYLKEYFSNFSLEARKKVKHIVIDIYKPYMTLNIN